MDKRKKRIQELRKGSTKKAFWEKYKNYDSYLKSEEWFKVKNIFLSNRKYPKCAYCNTKENLQVHHLSYNRLGTTGELKDLMVFCSDHHEQIHKIEKEEKVSIRTATYKLLKSKPKKQPKENKFKEYKGNNRKRRLESLQRQARQISEKKERDYILKELKTNGIRPQTTDLNILKKLKVKYL
jgi:hypothetical protein